MNLSVNGINILKQLEGCVKQGDKHVIYNDKTGRPVNINKPLPCGATIGYGHLIKSGEYFKNGITEIQATDLLRCDIAIAERAVQNNVGVPLNQNQYDALVLLAYNIGANNFVNSTVIKYINNPSFHSRKYPDLKSAWVAWTRVQGVISPGLINRRKHEWDLYCC